MEGKEKDGMKIKRNILGERIGSAFGTIEFILSEEELREAYNEYIRLYVENQIDSNKETAEQD